MIRKAKVKDVKQIQKLISVFAQKDIMLPRSLNEIYENLRDFFVCEKVGKVCACCALHISWGDLAEVKSLAVASGQQSKGIGRQLVKACLDEAKKLGIKKVFVLTYVPKYFKIFNFKRISKSQLPHKVWSECIHCVKFPDCDEVPMMRKV